jgi:hypothetical protein
MSSPNLIDRIAEAEQDVRAAVSRLSDLIALLKRLEIGRA